MFLKSLVISNDSGIVREIKFHAGMNLIVDETPIDDLEATGNNVGKTTVLMLIDFCLGADGKGVYIDPENKKNEYSLVKSFLVDTHVLIKLTLSEDLQNPFANEIVIERNFLPRKEMIRKINGSKKMEKEFDEYLTNRLFSNHYDKKPTFRQIISHNIRYKDSSLTNTLRTLDSYTRDEEYEALYLFLFGCDFDDGNKKQDILFKIRTENAFKTRLEELQTKSAYEASLELILDDINKLNLKRASIVVNEVFEKTLHELNEVKYQINLLSSKNSKIKLRREIISEAIASIKSNFFEFDEPQLKELYDDVTGRLSDVHKSFEDLVKFHNKMVQEKVRYISKELPSLDSEIFENEKNIKSLLKRENHLANSISKTDSFEEFEKIISLLNEKHRYKGEYEAIINQIKTAEDNIRKYNSELDVIDNFLFSTDFEYRVKMQLSRFNTFFSRVSEELYGERYAVKHDVTKGKKNGKKFYKFSSFNTNFSSGKKQGEITCFDIAYTLFADSEDIPCYHFLLNDKKELMHDNQLVKIAGLVEREKNHVQFVASILRDKLPFELNQERFFVVQLSQSDKLFKIEGE